jgi:hypothetical protein
MSRIGILKRIEGVYDGFAVESLVVSTTVVALTSSIYEPPEAPPAIEAFFSVENASIRITYHGEDPSIDFGHLLENGQIFKLQGLKTIKNLRCIRATDTDAKIRITYER